MHRSPLMARNTSHVSMCAHVICYFAHCILKTPLLCPSSYSLTLAHRLSFRVIGVPRAVERVAKLLQVKMVHSSVRHPQSQVKVNTHYASACTCILFWEMHIYNLILLLTQYDFSSSIVVCDTLSLRWRLIHIMHLHACMHLYPFWEMHIYNSSDSVWFLYYAHAQHMHRMKDPFETKWNLICSKWGRNTTGWSIFYQIIYNTGFTSA